MARPGQNCQKSSKMSTSEHANLAEYIERALLGAPIPLRNPFGKIIFLKECLKRAQNATGTSQMHFSRRFGFLTFFSKMDFLKMAILLKRPSHTYTAPITCTITCNITCNRRRQRGQTGPELSKIFQNEHFRTRKSRRVLATGPFGGANSFKESFW